jgi:glycosyltransferase involved in cell wall biosynthesis
MKLSIVIPTHNRCAILRKTLDALCKQSELDQLQDVIVVSDGSTDNTAGVVDEFRKCLPIKFLQLPKGNVSRTRNAGLHLAQGEIVIFLDDDIIACPEFVAEHAKFHRALPEPESALLGYVTWSPEFRITPFMRWYGEYGGMASYSLIRSEGPIDHSFLVTANVSIKREFALRVGGFNPKLTVHEDYEFSDRLATLGMKLYFRRTAVGYHYHSYTFEQACQRCQRLSSNRAPFFETSAGRAMLKKEASRTRRVKEAVAKVPAAMLSPLLRYVDSDVVMPNVVYRLLYWDKANRPFRSEVAQKTVQTFRLDKTAAYDEDRALSGPVAR